MSAIVIVFKPGYSPSCFICWFMKLSVLVQCCFVPSSVRFTNIFTYNCIHPQMWAPKYSFYTQNKEKKYWIVHNMAVWETTTSFFKTWQHGCVLRLRIHTRSGIAVGLRRFKHTASVQMTARTFSPQSQIWSAYALCSNNRFSILFSYTSFPETAKESENEIRLKKEKGDIQSAESFLLAFIDSCHVLWTYGWEVNCVTQSW